MLDGNSKEVNIEMDVEQSQGTINTILTVPYNKAEKSQPRLSNEF
jgi:hypothetical protein